MIFIFIISKFFFVSSGIYFPLKEISKTLNPGFGVEIGKSLKIINLSFSFKNFSFEKNSQTSFSTFSISGDFFYNVSKNFSISFGPSFSLIKLQKKEKEEFGTTLSFSSFLNLFSFNQRFFPCFGFEFLKGYKENIFLMGMKLRFTWD